MSRALHRTGLSPTHWSEIQSRTRSNGANSSSEDSASVMVRRPRRQPDRLRGAIREAMAKADGARRLAAAFAAADGAHAAARAFEAPLLTPAAMQPGTRRPT
jgi:hypothetical protein